MDANAGSIITAIVGTGGVVSVLWAWGNAAQKSLLDSKDEQIKALKAQALSSDVARIAAEQARVLSEQARLVLEERYRFLSAEYKDTSNSLRELVRVETNERTGQPLASSPPPKDKDEPTLRYFIDTPKDRDYAAARVREREQSLNPEAERREREGYRRRQGSVDAQLEDYLSGLKGLGPGLIKP